MGIEARSYGSSPDAELSVLVGCLPNILAVLTDAHHVGAKFLSQSYQYGVLQVRPPGLNYVIELIRFYRQSSIEGLK